MARRMGCSHTYCRKVAIGFKAGRIPFLEPDEASLLVMRESLGLSENQAGTALAEPARANEGVVQWVSGTGTGCPPEPRVMTVDERIAETWREVAEWKRKHPIRRSHVVFRVPIPR
jgi:hypothetical protein